MPQRRSETTTDATGRYDIDRIAMDSSNCMVTVMKSGFTTKNFYVTETCRVPRADGSNCPKPPKLGIERAP